MRSITHTTITCTFCALWACVTQVRCAPARILFALALAGGAAHPQAIETQPPPEGATTEVVLRHVLAESLGAWQRSGETTLFGLPDLPHNVPDDAQAILDYDLEMGARADYLVAEGNPTAQVIMLAFGSALDALGVFVLHRDAMTQQVATARAGYLETGRLHLYAGRFYLRITPGAEGEEADRHAQSLAAELEARLPPPQELPRLMRVLPRRWLNPFRVDYRRIHLFGADEAPKALIGEYELGDQPLQLIAVQAEDAEQSRRYYAQMRAALVQQELVSPVPGLAEEAFVARHAKYGICAGIRQDQFVAAALGAPDAKGAEAIMRLVATNIRTTRPLPAPQKSED